MRGKCLVAKRSVEPFAALDCRPAVGLRRPPEQLRRLAASSVGTSLAEEEATESTSAMSGHERLRSPGAEAGRCLCGDGRAHQELLVQRHRSAPAESCLSRRCQPGRRQGADHRASEARAWAARRLSTYVIDFKQEGPATVVTTENRKMPPELAAKMQYDIDRWKRGASDCNRKMPAVASAPAASPAAKPTKQQPTR